jgi:LPXTG-site transpeptidase (sortase) family protein
MTTLETPGTQATAPSSRAEADTPTVSPSRSVLSAALGIVAVLFLAFVLNLVLVSKLSHRSAQDTGYAQLRKELALGTAPVSQVDYNGKLLRTGTPVAIMNIPQAGIRNEVVFNGTSGGVLTKGPGHQRDTVLPGQVGQSIIQGRAAAYGGPFAHLERLEKGEKFTVTTGQGTATYQVIDQRIEGDPSPSLQAGHGLLTLVTARGTAYMPAGVLRVDAALVSAPQSTPALMALGPISASEQPMATEPQALLPLVLWLQGVLVVVLGAVFAWYRWGRWQTWLVFGPLALLVGMFTADQITLLLPNLT